MRAMIRGQVLGQNGMGISNLGVELWESDEQGNLLGNKPLLQSITFLGGYFGLNLRLLPPDKELPDYTSILFLDRAHLQVGRLTVTPEVIAGQAIRYESPELIAGIHLNTWPQVYSALKQIPANVKENLKLTPQDGLIIESVPQVSYFATYPYLPPTPEFWPWQVSPEEFPDVHDLKQPFLLGAQVLHKQEWHFLGHARGELIHSLPLAPGEETTIEILTWDRNVYKREEEITSDLEREVEENRQFKDSREVLREMQKNKQWKVGGGFGLDLGIVKFDASGGYEAQSQSLDRTTRSKIVETTDRVSTKLHEQRKTLISSTREFGREEKVTRKITNTNRCHSVTYHFYEVLRNYRLLTSLASPAARPCIFVKQERPISTEELMAKPHEYNRFLVALHWLHLNSHLIARRLLDRSLFRGLDVLPDLVAYWTMHRGLAATDINLDPVLEPPVRRVISKAEDLYSYTQYSPKYYLFCMILTHARWMFEQIISNSNSLKNEYEGRDQQHVNVLQPIVYEFLQLWNESYARAPEFFRSLFESDSYRKYLYNDVLNLERTYIEWVYGPRPGEEASAEELARMRDVSEVVRLLRHIERNYLHYFQFIWAAKDAAQRLLEASDIVLPGNIQLADVIEPDLLGFYGDYAIFPFKGAVEGSALAQLVQAFLDQEMEPPRESEVVLPSNGIVVESQLGEYTACEPFIEQHRVHDLQLKELEVEKARLENQRRSKKIRNCQLENPECCPSPKYGFLSRLFCRLKGKKED